MHTRYNYLDNVIIAVDMGPTGRNVTSVPTLSQNFQETNIKFLFLKHSASVTSVFITDTRESTVITKGFYLAPNP